MPSFSRSTDQPPRRNELTNLSTHSKSAPGRFAVITRLAQRMLKVPVAAISLLDRQSEELKARYGINLPPLPQEVSPGSFHAPTVSDPAVFEHADEIKNKRDKSNQPDFRFFLSCPLYGPQQEIVGAFWVADYTERVPSADDLETLKDLAAIAQQSVDAIELESFGFNVAQSEASTSAILENVIDGILTIDAAGLIKTANRAALEIFGYQREEMVGLDAAFILLNTSEPVGKRRMDAHSFSELADGKTRVFQGKRKDGSYFPLELAVTEMGTLQCKCYAGIVRDSTERQRNERAIRESARLLQSVMDSTSSYVHVRDLDGRYLYVNKEYERVFGVAKADVIGKTIEDVFPPRLAKKYRASERAVIASGQVASTEAVVEQDDGPHTYLVVRSPLFNELGEIYGASGVGTDISVSKQTEDELKLLNRELAAATSVQQAILNSANFAIIATAIDGTIRIFSAGAERMLGYKAREMIGLHTPAFLHDPEELKIRARQLCVDLNREISPGFEVLVAKTLEGHADENEWTYIAKDGRRFPVMLSVTALWNEAGHITGFLGIAYDITERKKVENMKNEFISTVSHELRTPLTSIRGALGLVAGGKIGSVPSTAKSMLEIAITNCERLSRLINDILDIEKIESGNMRFDMVRQPLLPLVKEAIAAMGAYAEQLQVHFILDAVAPGVEVMADADRLTQVIVNLLSNAIKFSPRGGKVHISVARHTGMIRLSVSDEGEGIRDDFRQRVFERFAQADASDTKRRGGTGLGLNISKAIIEKHAGKIDFRTRPSGGTEFYIELLSASRPGPSKEQLSVAKRGCRILIYEPEPELAQALELALMPAGFACDIAASTEQACTLANEHSYDAIVLDLAAPADSEISVLKRLRKQEFAGQVPVIVISPKSIPLELRSGFEAAPTHWLPGPIEIAQFVQKVQCVAQFENSPERHIIHIGPEDEALAIMLNSWQLSNDLVHVDCLNAALDLLKSKKYDLIVLDASLSQQLCVDLSHDLPRLNGDTPIILASDDEPMPALVSRIESALAKSCHNNTQWLATLHNLISHNARA